MKFKSKKDGKEFKLKLPVNSEEIENNDFIEIDGKLLCAEEMGGYDLPEAVKEKGELVYSVPELYDLYYFEGFFYDFYWDTASGCIFSKLKEVG